MLEVEKCHFFFVELLYRWHRCRLADCRRFWERDTPYLGRGESGAALLNTLEHRLEIPSIRRELCALDSKLQFEKTSRVGQSGQLEVHGNFQ